MNYHKNNTSNITWFHHFFPNILSFKLLKRCYLHFHYIRINKQTLFLGKNSRFLDSRFVKLSDEPIKGL